MTGFGRGMAEADGVAATCDVKSVNHRFLDVKVRLPRELLPREAQVVDRVRSAVGRGRVDVTVRIDVVGRSATRLVVDAALAADYVRAAAEIAEATGQDSAAPTVTELAAMDGVVTLRPADVGESAGTALLDALDGALSEHRAMRESEGRALAEDLSARCSAIGEAVTAVESRAEDQLPRLRDKMHERLRTLLGETPVDEDRVLTEAAVLADRADVTEEVVRLHQHLAAFREAMETSGSVGRKLDFLAQEMLREANTIGSKAWDPPISLWVIDIKSDVERIREQVQNIE